MVTKIILARHGETFGNRQGKLYGHAETALTPRGTKQAEALGKRLKQESLAAVYTSDLSRAADTAQAVVAKRKLEAIPDARFREIHYGDWEELEVRQVAKDDRDGWHEFLAGDRPAPNGEDVTALRWRVTAAVRALPDKHKDGTVLVVSHGSAIMAIVAELLGVPTSQSWAFAINNASITRVNLSSDGQPMLVSLNDHSHV